MASPVQPFQGLVSGQQAVPDQFHPAVKEISMDRFQFDQLLSRDKCLEFSDGSQWKLYSEECSSWKPEDRYVIVAPEANSEKYRIYNLMTGAHVKASLLMAPRLNLNPPSIFEMNYLSKTLELTDGHKFDIDSSADVQQWNENDVLILGLKNSPSKDLESDSMILINASLGCFAGATLLNAGH